MVYKGITTALKTGQWATDDFRPLRDSLILDTQNALYSFTPADNVSIQDNPIQLIDFFCGAGGTSLGFTALNSVVPAFHLLGGCDINQCSATTYSNNFGTPIINRDIKEVAYVEGELEKLLTSINYNPQKPTVLIGCAPCQGFTSHRKRHWNEEDDLRNNLIVAFATIVKKINPNAFIMENVPEFLSVRYWDYYSAAKQIYEECGYVVKACIYNAASFGVPQERFRSIVIGMKHDFVMPSGNLNPPEYHTVRDAIGHLPAVAAGVADPTDRLHKSAAHKQSTLDVIRQVPHNGGSRPVGVGPSCLDKTSGFSDVYGRLYWDKPSITITHYARNPASGRYTHPEQDRGLTAREAALLQSFPNGFEFTGKSDDIFRQIGEAVPPLFSSAIAASILVELLSTTPTDEELQSSPSSIESPVSSSYSSVIASIKAREKDN